MSRKERREHRETDKSMNVEPIIARLELRRDKITQVIGLLKEIEGDTAPLPAPKPVARAAKQESGRAAKPVRQNYQLRKGPRVKSPPQPIPSGNGHVMLPFDKPDSLGAAMKRLIATLPAPFTQADVREKIEADAHSKALLDAANPSTFYNNLAYWTKTERISKTGEGDAALYTLLDAAWAQPKEA